MVFVLRYIFVLVILSAIVFALLMVKLLMQYNSGHDQVGEFRSTQTDLVKNSSVPQVDIRRQVIYSKRNIIFPQIESIESIESLPIEIRSLLSIMGAFDVIPYQVVFVDSGGYRIIFNLPLNMSYNEIGSILSRSLAKEGMNFQWNENYGFAEARGLKIFSAQAVRFEWSKTTEVYNVSLLIKN